MIPRSRDEIKDLFAEEMLGFSRILFTDIQDRLQFLNVYDRAYEINTYCDDLESQITFAVESAIKNLNQQHKELLQTISEYRQTLLGAINSSCSIIVDSKNGEWVKYSDADFQATKQELAALEEKFRELRKAWAPRLEYLSEYSKSAMIEEGPEELFFESLYGTQETFDLHQRVKKLRCALRSMSFQKRFLKFKENHIFHLTNDHLGQLECNETEFREEKSPEIIRSNQLEFKLDSAHSRINALVFITCYTIATVSADWRLVVRNRVNSVVIWDQICPEVGFSLLLLPSHNLVSGHDKGLICIWDWQTQSLIRQLRGHKGRVHSLKAQNNKLFSSDEDGTIIIWNPFAKEGANLLMRINGIDSTKSPLGILSNDFLVTCSYHESNSLLRIFDDKSGRLTEQMETSLPHIVGLLVLPNNNVALASAQEPIHIFNVVEKVLVRKLKHDDFFRPSSNMFLLPNGIILSDSDSYRKSYEWWLDWFAKYRNFSLSKYVSNTARLFGWNPESGLRTSHYCTGTVGNLLDVHISEGGRLTVATIGFDELLEIWSFDLN